jgi:hypothetical protein
MAFPGSAWEREKAPLFKGGLGGSRCKDLVGSNLSYIIRFAVKLSPQLTGFELKP